VQGHREGSEGADPSKTQRGVAEYINALLLGRLAPPRHSGRWVGARSHPCVAVPSAQVRSV
jgi:hypothetical protein